ncbi:MAG: flippase-like domain-containing protein, partial [Gemmatimonadetes bacterium]|nr:flippase-like domain-containing protein [Gemmatimonadota bacterium]
MRTRWMTILGLAIAAFLIWWLLRHEDPAEVWGHVRDANFGLLALAVLVTTAVFPLRAIRWRYFLAPAQPDSPFRSRFAAVCVGFMANNLLPARAGELARAYAYSRLEPVSTATALATLVVERFLDGVVILLLLVVALAHPDFPSGSLPDELVAGVRGASLFLAVVLLVCLVLLTFPERSLRAARTVAHALLPTRIAAALVTIAEHIVAGLASMRGWRLLLPAFAWSLAVWTMQSLSFWAGFFAFGINLRF